MRKIFLVLLTFISFGTMAQTVEDVVQKYAANLGGVDAFNKVKTAKMTGTLTVQGMDLPLVTQVVNGKSIRSDLDLAGQSITTAYHNGTGWKVNPPAGITTAVPLTTSEMAEQRAQASLANNLMDYKSRGHQVEMLGQEDVDGIKTYKLKLTRKEDGNVTTYFISVADYILVKSVTMRDFQGQEIEVESLYSDLKAINGLKFFMHRVARVNGETFQEINYDKIELDVPVDAAIFQQQ
jgi:hypothetical protein